MTATLPNEPVSGDEVLSYPLLASPPGKEVKKKGVHSSDSEMDLFAPPLTAPGPQKKVKEKKALPSAPPKVKGKKVLPSAPPPPPKVKGTKALPTATIVDPATSKRRTRSTIPSEATLLGVGDWSTDKDIVCSLNQELCHMEISEPRVRTLALLYMKRQSKYMQSVESGTSLANMRWCRRPIFVVTSDDKEGLHWFVSAFDCRLRLELFTIWVWESLSSSHLICPFLLALKKLSLTTTKHRALGFQMDVWSCGFQSFNIVKLVVEHRGYFFRCAPCPNGFRFCGLCAQHC